MKVKIKCIKKNRDAKGNIKSYLLQKETGEVIEATGQQIKSEIAANNYEFINLQIDKAGRLVDKALKQDKAEELLERLIAESGETSYEILDETKRKKYYLCKKKIIAETIKALEEGIVMFNEDSVHATDRYSKEIEKVKRVWNSLLPDMPDEYRESFETLEFDLAEAAVFYTEHGRKLYLGVAINDFAGMESNYSYSEDRIRSACNALAYDIAGLLAEREEYEGWEREDLIDVAKNYIDTNIEGFKVDYIALVDKAIEEIKLYGYSEWVKR